MTLIKSHRAIGREVGRTESHVIIETAPQPGCIIAQPAHMTQPALGSQESAWQIETQRK